MLYIKLSILVMVINIFKFITGASVAPSVSLTDVNYFASRKEIMIFR